MIRYLVIAAALGLASCGDGPPRGAVDAAQRLMTAAAAQDRVAFEAEIDRPAVRDDLRRQVAELAKGSALDVEGGPSEFALDRMISPAALRVSGSPTAAALRARMRLVGRHQVCLGDDGSDACLLTFARTKGHWRLVGMRSGGLRFQWADLGRHAG